MKKLIFAFLCMCLICSIASAQSGWFLQNPFPQGNMLFSSKFLNDNTGYMVGENVILKTTNGGQSVIFQSSPIAGEMNSVWFADANNGYIVGGSIGGSTYDGFILKTTNGGNTWNTLVSGIVTLWGMHFFDVNTGFVSGGNGNILKTTNAGQNWTSQSSNTTTSLWSINFINTQTGFVTGGSFNPNDKKSLGDGLILKTTNGGANWSVVLAGQPSTYFGIHFPNSTTGYATGANGAMLKSIDGGNNWSILNPGTNCFLFGLYATDASTVTICGASMSGNGGPLLRSTNGGANWNNCLSPADTNSFLIHVGYSSSGTGYAVGNGGKMMRTINGGANWTCLSSSATYNDVEGIFFKNNTGFGIARNENNNTTDIIYTSNGGSLWSLKGIHQNFTANALYFLDANTGFICGRGNNVGTVMKTTNGGNNWVTKFSSAYQGTDLYTMYFADYNTGYVLASSNMDNYKTTDGGNTWNYFTVPGIYGIVTTSSFINANTGYVTGGYGSYVAKTTDGCTNWTVFLGVGNNMNAIFAIDQNTVYAAGDTNKIYKTVNGGLNWTTYTISSYPSANITSIFFTSANTGYMVGEKDDNNNNSGLILYTSNAGNTWTTQNAGSNARLLSVYFINSSTGYISGHNGNILKTTTGGSIWVSKISSEVPEKYTLNQNYPNPFNPSTNIKFEVPKSSNVKIVVYDVLGKELAILINEKLKPGTYETSFDASEFPSGIYFYRLITDGFSETKKMIMIK